MVYQKNSKGQRMSKLDMVYAMVNKDHSNTHYANMYVYVDYYTYEEIQKEYKKCFNLN